MTFIVSALYQVHWIPRRLGTFEHDKKPRMLSLPDQWTDRVRMARHWLVMDLPAGLNCKASPKIGRHFRNGCNRRRPYLRDVATCNTDLRLFLIYYTNDPFHRYTHPIPTVAPFLSLTNIIMVYWISLAGRAHGGIVKRSDRGT